ncbi:hypothetical protein CC1G_07336 [Coprinopsis cinerea okayama7|uniref:Peptidase A1 domain-containing protein n=1 Tax=Coprinopsis cinerea (strain Okayama-7 / 130 / ATCC MYA-4618 / FGSC 9003) TaxID=240176 RepID=A8NNS9_COPC7|nr:hypothetical protein CC1G_07336 [Coprinopsis cinerea okayama7\|eukprot:XP_001835194.2 hypothetical protein CC1G_07336 [Coprinopsis cinerea okayama7\
MFSIWPDTLSRLFLFAVILRSTTAYVAKNVEGPGSDSQEEGPSLEEIARLYTRRTSGGIHLPIVPREVPSGELQRRDAAAIGLGNFVDVIYSVLLTVGGVTTPLILDTGSTDLWLMSDACTSGCTARGQRAPLYPQATFDSTGLEAALFYGDSMTGTSAFGVIGKDTVSLAGLTLEDQYFAAINRTNTSIIDTGGTGIFGLGFPINSVIWNTLFTEQQQRGSIPSQERRSLESRQEGPTLLEPQGAKYGSQRFPTFPLHSRFPSHLADLVHPEADPSQSVRRQVSRGMYALLNSFNTLGSFITRLILESRLDLPMVTVTMQRNTIDVGGNVGLLSIGEMPPDVSLDELTWVPVRAYSYAEGGLPAPQNSPLEEYPIAWEVMIDDVYLNGEKLPRSTLSPPSIQLSALVDTGNSLIRGPEDVVSEIYRRISGSRISSRLAALFPCDEPQRLEFSIGGKLFPVDPRDFMAQIYVDNVGVCVPNVVSTDPPGDGGYLFSWSLGVPFLKSVVSSYYFGNITYPTQDPPRMGFLSTVPEDADQRLRAAVASAARLDGNFPALSNAAPTGTATPDPGDPGSGGSSDNGAYSLQPSFLQSITYDSMDRY